MVNDFVMGSIVNAVQLLGVRLVVVLGHTKCGMVARAVHSWAKHEARKLSGVEQAAAGEVRAWSCSTPNNRWSLSLRSAPRSHARMGFTQECILECGAPAQEWQTVRPPRA